MTKQCVQDVSADRLLLLYVINHSCQQCHHFYITLLSFLFMLLALISITFHFFQLSVLDSSVNYLTVVESRWS